MRFFSATLSSMASAISRFGLAFSSAIAFSRLASLAIVLGPRADNGSPSMPPCFDFQA